MCFKYIPLLLLLCACGKDRTEPAVSPTAPPAGAMAVRVDTLSEIVARVRQQSRLFTTEFQIHKVVLFDDKASIGGKLFDIPLPGDRKVAIPMDVTLKGYIEMAKFSLSNVKRADSVMIITLPDPKVMVTASKIDHQQTRQYVSLGRSAFTDNEITALARQGKDSVLHHLDSFGIVEASRESAARMLVPLLCQMGFRESNIVVRFRKDFNSNELQQMIQPLNAK